MRRKECEVTNPEELKGILDACKVCRVGMNDQNGMYLVPMNFGYCMEKETLVLYFHSAKVGRKIACLKENRTVSFEMDCDHKLVTAEEACEYGYAYASIIGTGYAEFIEEYEAKAEALRVLMLQQTGQNFEFNQAMVQSVAVFKIVSTDFSGKRQS